MNKIVEFFKNNQIAAMILDGYFILIIVSVIMLFVLRNRKVLSVFVCFLVYLLIWYLSTLLELKVSSQVYKNIFGFLVIGIIVVFSSDIRRAIENHFKSENKNEFLGSSNDASRNSIAEAAFFLGSKKIGALITIEKHNTLDQYAEKAIQLNSDISKELLINIFSPLTPLHDGAVIIRGNKIRCAGAYYVLTQHEDLDKTTGSRHRAGLGISEVTDSLTIIVSEETGNISIAIEGIMIKIADKEKLLEYIEMFLK